MTDEILQLARFGSKFGMDISSDLMTSAGEEIPGGGVALIRLDRKQAEELKDRLVRYLDYVCKDCGKIGAKNGKCEGECKPFVDPRSTEILNPQPTIEQLEAEAEVLEEQEQMRAETEAQEQQDAEDEAREAEREAI